MLYVATRDWKWLALIRSDFVVAAVAAYFLFAVSCPRGDLERSISVFTKEAAIRWHRHCLRSRPAVGSVPVCIRDHRPRSLYVDQDFMICGDRRRDGKYFLHLHDSDLYELLYHVC